MFKAPAKLRDLDSCISECVERALKTPFTPEVLQQVSLPVKAGGLSVTLPSAIALSAFVSSSFASGRWVRALTDRPSAEVALQAEARTVFEAEFGQVPTEGLGVLSASGGRRDTRRLAT